jgi:hypothetical protein
MGIEDPEGIAFNPDNGHLYILASSDPYLIAETTIDGTLFRYLNISFISAVKPAGLAYAPASGDPGQKNLYIVARGTDNVDHPYENDGKMYEVSFSPDVPPAVDAGPDRTITLPAASAALNGTVIDGRNPSGAMNTTWSVIDAPPGGDVDFSDTSAVDTTASFSVDGVYELLLTADDSERSAIDTILINVNPAPVSYIWLPMILSGSTNR